MRKFVISMLSVTVFVYPCLATDDCITLKEPTTIDHPGPDCLAFMQGKWKTNLPDRKFTEEWTRLENGSYRGIRTVTNRDGEKSISKMRLLGRKYGSSLEIFENSRSYRGSMELLGPNNCRFVISNPSIVGLKSITYTQVEPGHVKVIIQSLDQDKTSTIEYIRL